MNSNKVEIECFSQYIRGVKPYIPFNIRKQLETMFSSYIENTYARETISHMRVPYSYLLYTFLNYIDQGSYTEIKNWRKKDKYDSIMKNIKLVQSNIVLR